MKEGQEIDESKVDLEILWDVKQSIITSRVTKCLRWLFYEVFVA